jgi:predicted permease
MGLHPRLGRLLDTRDETSAARVVVLSEAFWRTRLGGDPSIVGRTVTLGGVPFEVVGVIAGTFRGLEIVFPYAAWVPVTSLPEDLRAFSLSPSTLTDRRVTRFDVWTRLRPGVTPAQAGAEAAIIAQRLDDTYPARSPTARPMARGWTASLYSQDRRRSTEGIRTIVVAILVALAVVLLIACTNLANLALARGTARSQETAVRTALGASRLRLVREQLVEGALVVGAGAGLGFAILFRLVDYFTIDLPMGGGLAIPFRPEIDVSVLLACVLSTLVALLVFGLWPALQSTRADVKAGMGAGAGATSPKWRLHRNLIAWQVCGSVALLLVTVMSVRIVGDKTGPSAATSRYRDLALAQIDFSLNGVDDARARQLIDDILTDLRGSHDLQHVCAINGSLSAFDGTPRIVTRPDLPFSPGNDGRTATGVAATTPGFLATLHITIARGRGFTDLDDAAAPGVGLVSEQLARNMFQTTDVVGRTLLLSVGRDRSGRPSASRSVSIIGVTRDFLASPTATRPDRLLFVPLAQDYEARAPVLFVAGSANPSAAVGLLRSEIRKVSPDLVVSAAGTGAVLLEGPLFLLRIISALSGSLGGLALVLAMAGLFGILTHVVERRTREIGIRLAIGADRVEILRLVLRDGLHPVVKGLVLGLAIGLGSRIVLRGQIFTTIAAWDPYEFCVLPLIFIAAALVACALPAARASRVDPNVALRDL